VEEYGTEREERREHPTHPSADNQLSSETAPFYSEDGSPERGKCLCCWVCLVGIGLAAAAGLNDAPRDFEDKIWRSSFSNKNKIKMFTKLYIFHSISK